MNIEKLPSGLVVPKQVEKPSRKYGPLELVVEDHRKEAGKYFAALINMEAGGILSGEGWKVRRVLLFQLARFMLGDNWGCEEKC